MKPKKDKGFQTFMTGQHKGKVKSKYYSPSNVIIGNLKFEAYFDIQCDLSK